MITLILTFLAGSTLGAIGIALVTANKVSKAEEAAARTTNAVIELSLLRANIRAVQHNAKPVKGMRQYTVQTPSGRFGKFMLPEV